MIPERTQNNRSPATPHDFSDSDENLELPMNVSCITHQSRTDVRSTQNLIHTKHGTERSAAEAEKTKEPAKCQSQHKESCSSSWTDCAVKPYGVISFREEGGLSHEVEDSSVHKVTENVIQPCNGTNHNIAKENVNTEEESDSVMPFSHSMDDDNENVPIDTFITSCMHSVTPFISGDMRKDISHCGGSAGYKVMKRSSSLISDSGIESEPSSVAWPMETELQGRPSLDFSSEQELPKQIVLNHLLHRSCVEGLQMESNGRFPSGGIQASLTSINSLPYEDDQQQKQLSRLTKSLSAPQISSPEDTDEGRVLHVLLNQDTDTAHHQDLELCSEQSEFSQLVRIPDQILKNRSSEKNKFQQYPSEMCRITSVLSGESEGLLPEDFVERSYVKQSAVIGSQLEEKDHQTHTSGRRTPANDVDLGETGALSCSCGNKSCAHRSAAKQEGISSEDECQSVHQSKLQGTEEKTHMDSLQTSQKQSQFNKFTVTPRPSELTGLTTMEIPTLVSPRTSGTTSDCPSTASKISNSGLAFVNKKMVEVVNMSVSCAPTCLPFSSVLRDSPSVSGLSARQAPSPITHQPLGSFGIIYSSSHMPINMDEETNERMLK